MRKITLIVLLALLALFWPWFDNPLNYVNWKDRVRTSLPIAMAFGFPCETREGDTIFFDASPNCLQFDEPREFSGVWLSAFEGSTFIEGATVAPALRPPYQDVAWLQLEPSDVDPDFSQYGYDQQYGCYTISAFRLRFIGRKTETLGGHLGLWGSEVWPTRIINAEPIRSPKCNVYHGT